MKNIIRAIVGAGFLISGTVLLSSHMNLAYAHREIGVYISLAFMLEGIILSLIALLGERSH